MRSSTPFSETLKRLREEAGFKTACRFFQSNGGSGVFRFSYRTYLFMEAGRFLPDFNKIKILFYALRVVPASLTANSLVTAWLQTSMGAENYRDYCAPMLKEPSPTAITSPLHKALRSSLAQKKVFISPQQVKAIAASRTTYLCFLVMAYSEEQVSAGEIAASTGIKISEVQAAMSEMVRIKIAGKAGGGYISRVAGSMLELPHGGSIPMIYKKLDAVHKQLLGDGDAVYARYGVVRADALKFSDFLPLMSLNLSAAQAYAVTRKTSKTALFAIEGKVTKIMDF